MRFMLRPTCFMVKNQRYPLGTVVNAEYISVIAGNPAQFSTLNIEVTTEIVFK
jgi:hypothetical protein